MPQPDPKLQRSECPGNSPPPTHTYFLESVNETLPALGSLVPEQLSSFRSS